MYHPARPADRDPSSRELGHRAHHRCDRRRAVLGGLPVHPRPTPGLSGHPGLAAHPRRPGLAVGGGVLRGALPGASCCCSEGGAGDPRVPADRRRRGMARRERPLHPGLSGPDQRRAVRERHRRRAGRPGLPDRPHAEPLPVDLRPGVRRPVRAGLPPRPDRRAHRHPGAEALRLRALRRRERGRRADVAGRRPPDAAARRAGGRSSARVRPGWPAPTTWPPTATGRSCSRPRTGRAA